MTTPGIKAAAIPNTHKFMRETTARDHVDFDPGDGAGQPIMMMTTRHSTSGRGRWRGNNIKRNANGLIERLPSVANQVDSNFRNLGVAEATRGRYTVRLDEHGHTVAIVHSNAAAHAPKLEHGGRYSRDLGAQYQIDKSFALGRIDVNAGCLVRQLKDGTVNARTIVARELVGPKAKVCAKDAASCPHLETEKKARQAKNVERMAALEVKHGAADEAKDARLAAAIATALAKVSK